jgi:hypothetical protein
MITSRDLFHLRPDLGVQCVCRLRAGATAVDRLLRDLRPAPMDSQLVIVLSETSQAADDALVKLVAAEEMLLSGQSRPGSTPELVRCRRPVRRPPSRRSSVTTRGPGLRSVDFLGS